MRSFVSGIINDQAASAKLKEIWAAARNGGLTKENIEAFVTSHEQLLDRSQQLNFKRWPILSERVHQNPRALGSYSAEVEAVRKYMNDRIDWMDNKLGFVYDPTAIDRVPFDSTRPYAVYSASGQYRGNSLRSLPSGVYVVVQGQHSFKQVIR